MAIEKGWKYIESSNIKSSLPSEEESYLISFYNKETDKILMRIGTVTLSGGRKRVNFQLKLHKDDLRNMWDLGTPSLRMSRAEMEVNMFMDDYKPYAYKRIYPAEIPINWAAVKPGQEFKVLHKNKWVIMKYAFYENKLAYFYDHSYFSKSKKVIGFDQNEVKRID